jgi:hypothetical protein
VISPIQTVGIDGRDYLLPVVAGARGVIGRQSVALLLKEALDDIRYGKKADPYAWNFIV